MSANPNVMHRPSPGVIRSINPASRNIGASVSTTLAVREPSHLQPADQAVIRDAARFVRTIVERSPLTDPVPIVVVIDPQLVRIAV